MARPRLRKFSLDKQFLHHHFILVEHIVPSKMISNIANAYETRVQEGYGMIWSDINGNYLFVVRKTVKTATRNTNLLLGVDGSRVS